MRIVNQRDIQLRYDIKSGSVIAKYKHLLITCFSYNHIMNGKALAIGLAIFILSVFGYMMGPSMINQMMGMFTPGGTNSTNNSGMDAYKMMGIPTPEEMGKMAQYSFLGLMIAGLGVTCFGTLAKKKKPKQVLTTNLENKMAEPQIQSHIQPQVQSHVKREDMVDHQTKQKQRTLLILEERLARGEITSKEYVNLKMILDRS